MKNKLIICFPLEIKSREFYPKICLAYSLLKTNKVDVVIGDKKYFFVDFDKSKNLIFFYKGGGTHLINTFRSVSKNNFFFNLDEEGPISLFQKRDLDLKINKNIDKYIKKIFLWGDLDKKAYKLQKNFIKNKFKVFGHPKFDVLQKPFVGIFQKEFKQIKQKYKNFIFIPSHYTVDNVIDDENYYLYVQNLYSRDVKKQLFEEKKKYERFVNVIKSIAKDNPEKLFIFRPHPGQSTRKVKEKFGKIPKNLKIIFKYTVTPWIMACDHYIHSGCTTVFEAIKLNKTISYISNSDDCDNVWSKIGKKILIKDLLNKKVILGFQKPAKYPKKFVEKLVKNLTTNDSFGKNFISFLNEDDYFKNRSKLIIRRYNLKKNFFNIFISNLKKHALKIKIIARFLASIDPSLVFSKDLKDSKLEKISQKEIKKKLDLISKLDNSNYRFKITDLNGHIFRINRTK